MKKIAILTAVLMATQVVHLKAGLWDKVLSYFRSSETESTSSAAEITSPEGGTLTIGGETYEVPQGGTLTYSGGGTTTHIETEQEPGKEPVTTVEVEKHPAKVAVEVKKKKHIPVSKIRSEETKAELDAEIEASLDKGDGYTG